MKRNVLSVLIIIGFLIPRGAMAASGKEFTTSVVYGTLAGTLVGAATLAFTSSPGDNLNNVARGASYGLYAGILLGLYVTYGMGDGSAPEPELEQGPSPEQQQQDDGKTLEEIERQKAAPNVDGEYRQPNSHLRAQMFPLIYQDGRATVMGAGLTLPF